MLDEMANYATIILALAMINVVWQLEKASKLLKSMQRILMETANEYRE
jgi:hypothetical protein